jgi:hypothetical protein
MDNRKAYKLFSFQVNTLRGKVDYPSEGWQANINLDVMAKSMAFNTRKGSFIKNKLLRGPFKINYTTETQVVNVAKNKLNIGDDEFIIGAVFNLAKDPVDFKIDIHADELTWDHAAAILAPNIAKKLHMFDLNKPLLVNAIIAGDFGGGGDPAIDVNCEVRDNILKSPGGIVKHCSFDGVFTNHLEKGKEFGDANSAIKLNHFSGFYGEIPFTADTMHIINFDKPIAVGIFKSQFDMSKLSSVLGNETFKVTKGIANLDLKYKADIVDFQFNKPILQGVITMKDADIIYVPRDLKLRNTSLSLNFIGDDLYIKNIRLQSGRSVALMEGKVSNFMNLYYSAPEKILLTWDIHSPQVYLGEFLGILNARAKSRPVKRTSRNVNFCRTTGCCF